MIKIERLVFNPFQENTYLIYDESGECAIIDPGCSNVQENDELDKFISDNSLNQSHIFTHIAILIMS